MFSINNPIDLILLAVAVTIVAKLYFVLGKQTDIDRKIVPTAIVQTSEGEMSEDKNDGPAEAYSAEIIKTLDLYRRLDKDFDIAKFLEGAKTAHMQILQSFEDHDFAKTQHLLAPQILEIFKAELNKNKAPPNTNASELATNKNAEIVETKLENSIARITVHFSTAKSTEVFEDFWTFERDLKSQNPNWLLIKTEGQDSPT